MDAVFVANARGRANARQTRLMQSLARHAGLKVRCAPVAECWSDSPAIHFAGLLELNDRAVNAAPPELVAAGVTAAGACSHNQLGRRLLAALGERGVSVNWERRVCGVGIKSTLEQRCVEHEAAGGVAVPRPRTQCLLRAGAAVPPLDAEWRIAKRANGTRAEGLAILPHHEPTPPELFPCVEQELLPSPLLIGGHKVDCRAYVLLWNRPAFGYTVSSYVRVRYAAAPYRRGLPEAEICSTSLARRNGFAPRLSHMAAVEAEESAAAGARAAVHAALDALMAMVARSVPPTPFFSIWGVDVALVHAASEDIGARLLEVNVFPQIYNGDPAADDLTDAELVPELAACLLRHAGGELTE